MKRLLDVIFLALLAYAPTFLALSVVPHPPREIHYEGKAMSITSWENIYNG